jgi:hypothetical protein
MSLTNLKTIERDNSLALLEVQMNPTSAWLLIPLDTPPDHTGVIDFSNENYRFYLDMNIARDAFCKAGKGIELVGKWKGTRWADMKPFLVSH